MTSHPYWVFVLSSSYLMTNSVEKEDLVLGCFPGPPNALRHKNVNYGCLWEAQRTKSYVLGEPEEAFLKKTNQKLLGHSEAHRGCVNFSGLRLGHVWLNMGLEDRH